MDGVWDDGRINLSEEGEFRIGMNEGRNCTEGFLYLVEGFSSIVVPGQRLGPIAKQGGDWRTDLAEFVYESPIEVGEPVEALQLLDR